MCCGTFLLSSRYLRLKKYYVMTYIRITLISIIFALISSIALSEDFKIISFKGAVEISLDQELWDVVEEGELVKTGSWLELAPKLRQLSYYPMNSN